MCKSETSATELDEITFPNYYIHPMNKPICRGRFIVELQDLLKRVLKQVPVALTGQRIYERIIITYHLSIVVCIPTVHQTNQK